MLAKPSVRTLIIPFAALTFGGLFATTIARAQRATPRSTAADAVYTEAQATRGQAVYVEQCQPCHGATLGGGLGPPLAGAAFLGAWDGLSLADLVDKIQHTMPATNPGTLSRAQATDLVAHLLRANAFSAGPAELRADDSLAQVALVAPPGAPRAALARLAPPHKGLPHGHPAISRRSCAASSFPVRI